MNQEKTMTHDRLQQEIYQWLWNTYPTIRRCFWHTANEFSPENFVERNCTQKPAWLQQIFNAYKQYFVQQLAKRKAIGVLPGVTDLVLYIGGVLLMMDIKLPGDKLSEAQLAFIAANEKQGGIFVEINTLEQGKNDVALIIDNLTKENRIK